MSADCKAKKNVESKTHRTPQQRGLPADDDHADGDDDGDAAGDGAADGAQQQQDHLHHEVDGVPGGLVRVPDPPKQRVVGGGLGVRVHRLLVGGRGTPRHSLDRQLGIVCRRLVVYLVCGHSAGNVVVGGRGGQALVTLGLGAGGGGGAGGVAVL